MQSIGHFGRRLLGPVVALLVVLAAAVPAWTQDDPQSTIDNWNAALERIDAAVGQPNITERQLQDHRGTVQKIVIGATELAESLAPRVTAAENQFKELAPTEGAETVESDAVKAERSRAEKELAQLSGARKQAQAVVSHANYTLITINDQRRQHFTRELFESSASLINPSLWADVMSDLPRTAERAGSPFAEWFKTMRDRADRSVIALVLFLVIAMVVVLIPGRRFLLSFIRRPDKTQQPTQRQKAVSAALIVAVNTFVPLIALIAGHTVLSALDLSPDRVDQLWLAGTSAVVYFSLAFGVIRALIAPTRPNWRLVAIEDQTASRLFTLAVGAVALQALLIFLDGYARIVSAPLAPTIVTAGLLSIATAILIVMSVRLMSRRGARDEEDGDDDEAHGGMWRVALPLAGLLSTIAIVADLIGYVAFGRFLTSQIIWIAIVWGLLRLLLMLSDELTAAWFHRDGLVGSRLVASVGFAPRSVTQAGVLVNGVIRLILVAWALLALATPWGVDSTGLLAALRAVFFGFKIGSISITPSTIAAAVVVFLAGFVVTRAVQNWLDTRFLPTTRLDSGLRNSIRTSTGYLGMILAAVFAFGYAGVDLSSIAIVAGALSVGIGLGLQSIVNNFVSGLILLAERPIRAGDWITVGAEEGTVKRINVRATEIETFDRATVIVPNSSLISGVVKNMVLRDRSGRVTLPVQVAKTSDPDVVKTILLDCAKAHPLVLGYPEPAVYFLNFGTTSLDFELRCYLADISNGGSVRSDLRFAVLRRLREAEIGMPG